MAESRANYCVLVSIIPIQFNAKYRQNRFEFSLGFDVMTCNVIDIIYINCNFLLIICFPEYHVVWIKTQ